MANDNGKPTTPESTYLHTITILQSRIRVLEETITELESQLEIPFLQGRDEIMKALKMSEYKYNQWVKLHLLPILKVDNTHYAYRDNLKEHLKRITAKSGEIKTNGPADVE